MKLTNPYFLLGLVLIIVGVVLYYYDLYTFPMYGLPMTTIVLAAIGLILMFLGLKEK